MTGNPEKGEVSFDAPSGETYVLQFDIDKLCMMESVLSRPAIVIDGMLRAGWLSARRAALWAGLQEHRPGLSLKQAGDLIPLVPDIDDKINQAMRLAFPRDGEAAKDGATGPRKPKTAAGTGADSSAPGAS